MLINVLKNRQISVRHKKKTITLKPGSNQIDVETLKELGEHKGFMALVANDEIEVVENGEGVTDEGVDILALDEKKAISLVKKTFDRDALEGFAMIETREKVLKALEKQMEETKPPEPKEPKKDAK